MSFTGNHKRTLYVGGLDSEVNAEVISAAFVPFGPLRDVQVPIEYKTQKSKGFAFVEFEDQDDAAAALDNMHGKLVCCISSDGEVVEYVLFEESELFGRIIKVTIAKSSALAQMDPKKPVWAEGDLWFKEKSTDTIEEKEQDDDLVETRKERDTKTTEKDA